MTELTDGLISKLYACASSGNNRLCRLTRNGKLRIILATLTQSRTINKLMC